MNTQFFYIFLSKYITHYDTFSFITAKMSRGIFFIKVLKYCKLLWYTNLAKQNQINVKGMVFSFMGIPYIFVHFFEFCKTANSTDSVRWFVIPIYLVLFGDNRSLRFRCVNFGWRTFLFRGVIWCSHLKGGYYKFIIYSQNPKEKGIKIWKKYYHYC